MLKKNSKFTLTLTGNYYHVQFPVEENEFQGGFPSSFQMANVGVGLDLSSGPPNYSAVPHSLNHGFFQSMLEYSAVECGFLLLCGLL